MSRLYFFILVIALFLSGCSSPPEDPNYAGRLTPYQHLIGAQLFAKQPGLQRVAVSSFVPADTLSHDQSNYTLLARQLQEGVMSEANNYQVGIIEYRLTQQLQLDQQQERALSRNPHELRDRYRFDYLVVGTYSEVEDGILVNSRLVETRSGSVVSAASVLVPWLAIEAMPAGSQWRRGGLYRQSVNEG